MSIFHFIKLKNIIFEFALVILTKICCRLLKTFLAQVENRQVELGHVQPAPQFMNVEKI